jgi:hypothetical protein
MTGKAELEDFINLQLQKKFKTTLTDEGQPLLEAFQIIVKPSRLDFDSPEIERLIMRVTSIHMSSRGFKYINLTQLFNPILELCIYCKEDRYVEMLNDLWAKGTIGISIPDLERKIGRGGSAPRLNGKIINFDKLNYSFKQVEQKLDLIFFYVCTRNNIKVSTDMSAMFKDLKELEDD